VHARDADDDCMDIIFDEIKNGGGKILKGVLHCFSSGEKMANQALDIGFYISFSGMITFKNMQWLRDISAQVPHNRVLIETDAPFLAPMPYRGKTNQPAYVQYTALELAKIYNLTQNEVGLKTSENFFNLFDKARDTWIKP
jgi:TatD DNase family protein